MARQFDLIVVGGGINGAGIARDAALRGVKVLLIEARDFAAGASGHNGRMIHGGLRYLETAQIGLVREALRERGTLLRIAPHLVHRSTLLIPIRRGIGRPSWMVRLGLLALDILAPGQLAPHRRLNRAAALARVPSLRADTLRAAFVMQDAFAEHAERLTIENVVDAAAHGAEVHSHAPVTRIVRDPSGALRVTWRGETGDETAIAPVVVNSTGAWADALMAEAAGTNTRLVAKAMGSFIVMKPFAGAPNEAVFFEAKSDGRPIILTPWLGNLLVGTTDRVIDGPVEAAQAGKVEVDYLVEAMQQTFTQGSIHRSDILYTYTGVRPLPYATGQSHKIARKHVVLHHDGALAGMITVLGGKLSTVRSLAQEVTDKAIALHGGTFGTSDTARQPLPGAVDHGARALLPGSGLSDKTRARLLGLYGERSVEVLAIAQSAADLSEVIDDETGAIAAEFVFAVEHEFAASLADILLRRTLLGYRTGNGQHLFAAFRRIARDHLGWDDARIEADIDDYLAHVAATDGSRFHDLHPAPDTPIIPNTRASA
jgi:glycerol-3-phosphate dehydrogenase